jgi:hypothetical protein
VRFRKGEFYCYEKLLIKRGIMKKLTLLALLFTLLIFAGCQSSTSENKNAAGIEKNDYNGQIYLYGESHGVQELIEEEFRLWKDYYEGGMRHLFVELPYYTAEFLNIWMKEADDKFFNSVFEDWKGTASYNQFTFDFFKNIKTECPETVFHGTDIGHQFDTTGIRYLTYLENNNLQNSKQYEHTLEIIEQGKIYYANKNAVKRSVEREYRMVENFVYELGTIGNENIMGIYGSAHSGLNNLDNTGTIPSMANQLNALYPGMIYSEDLRTLLREMEPLRTEIITIEGKDYTAYYYGQQDISWLKGYVYREFRHLENAYDDLKHNNKTGDVLPFDNFPMNVKTGEVYVVDYTKTDNTKQRLIYIADGRIWNGKETTEEIKVK